MQIKLLHEGYKNDDALFTAFFTENFYSSDLFTDEYVSIPTELPDFPIYFGKIKDADAKIQGIMELIRFIEKHILNLHRDLYMDERFWHSLLCYCKRDYLLETYPEISTDINIFRNIVIKPFDWENYIYKAILAAQYVTDFTPADKHDYYYHAILTNMDIFNYIIKYEIFRNGNFLINILDIIQEHNLSKILKAKIKDRPDLGRDERYGRRVIFEFNKSYPIVLAPMLEKNELKDYFLKYLSYYYNGDIIENDASIDSLDLD